MKPGYEITEEKGMVVIKIQDGKISQTVMSNINDVLSSRQADTEKRNILLVIHSFNPAYFNEIMDVLGNKAKSTLSRELGKLVEEGVIKTVGPEDEAVQQKKENMKIRQGSGPSKFYRINKDRYVQEAISGMRMSVINFIQNKEVSENLLRNIKAREKYNDEQARKTALAKMPIYERVKRHILHVVVRDEPLALRGMNVNTALRHIIYQSLEKFPSKQEFGLIKQYLRTEGVLIEEEGKLSLRKPKDVDRALSDEEINHILVPETEDLELKERETDSNSSKNDDSGTKTPTKTPLLVPKRQ